MHLLGIFFSDNIVVNTLNSVQILFWGTDCVIVLKENSSNSASQFETSAFFQFRNPFVKKTTEHVISAEVLNRDKIFFRMCKVLESNIMKRKCKAWNFYFGWIVTEIVEKKHMSTPFNFFIFFFQIWHCLTLFPILLVEVNWIVFHLTAHLRKLYDQQILRKICYVVTKA